MEVLAGLAVCGLMAALWSYFLIALLERSPQLLERRLRHEEVDAAQKMFQRIFVPVSLATFAWTGLDFRFGWSRHWPGPVPLAVVLAAQALAVAGYWYVFWVMKTNAFASSTVQALLAARHSHAALRTGKQWHIGWGDTYCAFLRELPEEKLLVVYNNAPKAQTFDIPIENTPLESSQQLQTVFGNYPAELVSGKVRVSLPALTLSVFSVH